MTEEMAGSGNGRGQAWVRGCQEGSRVCRWLPLAEVGPQGEKAGEASRWCLKGALTPQADARLLTMGWSRWAGHDGKDDNEKAFTKEEFKPIKVSELRHHPKTGQKWEKRN